MKVKHSLVCLGGERRGGLHGEMLSYLVSPSVPTPVRGSVLVQIQTAGSFAPTAVFRCLGSFADRGAGFAPPRYAGGSSKFLEQGLFSFRNIICRRIRTWLPGLSLLHGGAGHSHPARESNVVGKCWLYNIVYLNRG